MVSSDLSSSLTSAIASADFGARLVIFGIGLEIIDLIVKCGDHEGFCKWFGDPSRFEEMNLKRLKRFTKFFHPWTLAIEISSFALVVYGLSIEVSGSNEAYRISGLQNSKLNSEAGEARTNAAAAMILYGEEFSNSVALLKQVEQLKAANEQIVAANNSTFKRLDKSIKERIEVETAYFPRTFSYDAQLEEYAGVKFSVVLAIDVPSIERWVREPWSVNSDTEQETERLFTSITNSLLAAKWQICSKNIDFSHERLLGVTVIVRPGEILPAPIQDSTSRSRLLAYEAAKSLVETLRQSQILTHFDVIWGPISSDTIDIIIGRKPNLEEIRSPMFIFDDERF